MLKRQTKTITSGTQIQNVIPIIKDKVESIIIATGYNINTPIIPTKKSLKT